MGRKSVQDGKGEVGVVEVQGGVEDWEGIFFFFFRGRVWGFGVLGRECLA